jgi:hypothetical protein
LDGAGTGDDAARRSATRGVVRLPRPGDFVA